MLTLSLLIIDFVSKKLALNWYMYHADGVISIFPFLQFRFAWNPGISFSFLSNSGEVGRWFLTFFALAVAGALVFALLKSKSKLFIIACSFIIAGAIGNAIDRILYGKVVDFISVFWQSYYFPIFNVADICISIGGFLYVLHIVFEQDKQS